MAGSTLIEAARFHVGRTDNEARFALALATDATVRRLVVERSWRIGGPLYLREIPTVVILDSDVVVNEQTYLSADGMTPGPDTVAITVNTCRLAGCAERLRSAGFVETDFAFSAAAGYRVFRR